MFRFACLIGNGLSIAFNPDMAVAALTNTLIDRFGELSGGDAEGALSQVASSLSGRRTRENFESLLAPLERLPGALDALRRLVALTEENNATREAVNTTIDFAAELHRTGTAIVLQLIDQLAHGQGARFHDVIVPVCRAIANLSNDERYPITLATLNYDGLIHAGLMELTPSDGWVAGTPIFSDLSAGYAESRQAPFSDGVECTCWELRNVDDLMASRRIEVLQLHGYLGWLWDPESDRYWKFELGDLRGTGDDNDYWSRLRDGEAAMTPVVVLTDRKTQRVAESPFNLAYQIFQNRLRVATHWLIGGSALSDIPVLTAYSSAVRRRRRARVADPKLLVVGRGDEERAEVLRHRASTLFGIARDEIEVDVSGFPAAAESVTWARWAS